jgi:hypothetical protein
MYAPATSPNEVIRRNFDAPDEEVRPGRGQVAMIRVGDVVVRRVTFEPGWRWTEDLGPDADTDLCQVPHLFTYIRGRLGVRMADGSEHEFGPGDVSLIPPGHDAWVVGDDPVVIIDQMAAEEP